MPLRAATMTWWLSPLTWLLVAAALLLSGGVRWRWLRLPAAALAALAVVGMTPLAANALVLRLERPAADADACRVQPPTVAVVLAGGLDAPQLRSPADAALNLASRRRMDAAVAYWHAGVGRRLVVTGTSQAAGLPPDALLMAAHAARLGVPAAAIHAEVAARTTWENAERIAAMRPALPRRITLVTSAMHMPRARFAFAARGFEVCAWPTDNRWVPATGVGALLPRSTALAKTEAALHELAGLAYYLARARAVPATARGT